MGMILTASKFLAFRAGSAALMAKQVADGGERVRHLAARDCDHLQRTGTIEPLSRSPYRPETERRSMAIVFLRGMVIGGLIVFVLSFLTLMTLTGMASEPASDQTRLLGSLLVSSLLGLGGLIVPGSGLGLGGVLGETKRRMDTAADAHMRSYWVARESIRQSLMEGTLSPQEARARLAPYGGVQQAPLSHQPPLHQPPREGLYPTYYDPSR